MSRVIKLAVIPGDGIGPEVVAEAEKVLDAVTAASEVTFDKTRFSLGAARYLETGDTLTDDDLAAVAAHDAILLGAVGGVPGDPRLKDANIERGLLLKLRFALDHYVNLRPSKLYPGAPGRSPIRADRLRRRAHGGPYVGNGGSIRTGTPHEVANETSVNTAFGIERVVRYAFAQAERRRKKLTLVHKTNVLVHAGGMWKRIVDAVASEHPEVTVDYVHIDAATIYLVTNPGRFDVIVTDNLFGDILTDLAGAVTGGIGLAASGNINPDGAFPRCSSPCTARRRTSRDSRRPIPRPRSSPSPSARPSRARRRSRSASPAPSRRTSPTGAPHPAPPLRSATPSSRQSRRSLEPPHARRPLTPSGHDMSLTYDPDAGLALWSSPSPEPRREVGGGARAAARRPAFGTTFTDHMVDICWSVRGGWHRPRVQPYGPLARPRRGRAALRAGDLRGHQGLPPRRRLDLDLPTRSERPSPAAQRTAPRAARAAGGVLHRVAQGAHRRRRRVGALGADQSLYLRPFMFAKEAFLGVRPANKVGYYVIASPVGAYFKGGAKPVSIWLSEDYARAGKGGTGAAKTGGNYAASLLPQAEAYEQGCDQVVFLDQDRNVEELGGMNVVFVYKDGTIVTPQSDSILEGITRDSILQLAADRGHKVEGARSRSTSGAGVASGDIVEVFACGTAAVVAPIGVLKGRDFVDEQPLGRSRSRCARSSPTSSTGAARTRTAGCAPRRAGTTRSRA
jgi:3-isopropylmalate dehydrogenase